MKKILFLSLACLFSFQQMIGQYILSGKVQDFNTEEELIGANIVISQNEEMIFGTATDENGEYTIKLKDIRDGTYEMVISYLGYESIKSPIHFDKNSGEIISSTFLETKQNQFEEVIIKAIAPPISENNGCIIQAYCYDETIKEKREHVERQIKESNKYKLKTTVFPNPTISVINIKTPTEVRRLLLFDANGRLLVNKNCNSLESSLDLLRFPAGQYLLQIITEELSETHKIIKIE